MKKQVRRFWRSLSNREVWRRVTTVALTMAMVLQLSPVGYLGAATTQPVDAAATSADTSQVPVQLDHAHLVVSGQTVAQNAVVSAPANADLTFAASADEGYENLKVSAVIGGVETPLVPVLGVYKLSVDQVQAGATVVATATKAAEAQAPTTTPIASNQVSTTTSEPTATTTTTTTTDATQPTDTTTAAPKPVQQAPAAPTEAAATNVSLASNGKTYDTVAQALAEATEGDTITLNVDLVENVTIAKGVTIDLGGHTLSGAGATSTITINDPGATVTVKNGTITKGVGENNLGGGINVQGGSLAAESLTLTGNEDSAIYAGVNAEKVTIEGCTMTGNTSRYGAIIASSFKGTADFVIADTVVKDNSVTAWTSTFSFGVCLYCNSAQITNCTVMNNSSDDYEMNVVATRSDSSSITMAGGSFDGNAIIQSKNIHLDGSGMTLSDGASFDIKNTGVATIENLTFDGSTKVNKRNGALVSIDNLTDDTNATLSNVTVKNGDFSKDANRNDAHVFEIFNDGARSTTTLTNCTIADNKVPRQAVYTAQHGADSSTTIGASRISGNQQVADGGAGAVYTAGGTLNVADSVIAGNTASGAGGIYVQSGAAVVSGGALYGNKTTDGDAVDVYGAAGATITLPKASDMKDGSFDFTGYQWDQGGILEDAYADFKCSSGSVFTAVKPTATDTMVASFNGAEYPSIEEAFDAVMKSGQTDATVKLIGSGTNVAMATTNMAWAPYVNINTTLDLNGHNLRVRNGGDRAIGTWKSTLKIVNSSDTVATLYCGLYSDGGNGGNITIESNNGNIKFDGDHDILMSKATLTLAGSYATSANVTVTKGASDVTAADGLTMGNGAYINVTMKGADDILAKFKDANSTPDDLVLVNGGDENLARHVKIAGFSSKNAVVMYSADAKAVVLHKLNRAKGIYVDGNRGGDTYNGTYNRPFRTMDAALKAYLAGKDSKGYEAIYVKGGPIRVNKDTTWDGQGVTVMRCTNLAYTGKMVYVAEGATLTLKNITFDGMGSVVSAKGSMFEVEGNLTLDSGATLQNNNAYMSGSSLGIGGAIEAGPKSTVTLNEGSTVAYNQATWGGGIYSAGNVVVNGGAVKGNRALSGDWHAYGGGICMANYYGGTNDGMAASLQLKGGTIANNTCDRNGGGVALMFNTGLPGTPSKQATLDMTGGTVSGNTANDAGGGIYIDAECVGNVSAGDITNNTAGGRYSVFNGGGIYVNGVNKGSGYTNGKLYLTNAIIADNAAGGNGGGFAGCPTSNVRIYLTDGAALYQNTAGRVANEVFTQSGTVGIHKGTPTITVSPLMLGGGAYLWTYAADTTDGAHKAGEYVDTADLSAATVIALNNAITQDSTQAKDAQALAQVHITGNKATKNGGGIGTDGDVTIGTAPSYTDISATKAWSKTDSTNMPDSVTFALQVKGSDGTWQDAAYKTATAEGEWKVTFRDLPKADGIEYRVVEKDENLVVAGADTGTKVSDVFDSAVTGSVDDGFTVTNTEKTTSVSATKVWSDNDNQDGLRSTVTLHLTKSVDGDEPTVVEGQDKVIPADATGDALSVTWDDLPVYEAGKKVTYSVTETGDCLTAPEGGTAAYTSTIEAAKNADGNAIANSFVVNNTHAPQTTSVRATKAWDDGFNQDGKRGDVTFTLQKAVGGSQPTDVEGAEVKTISATATGAALAVSWDNLPVYEGGQKVTYSVKESALDGYTSSVANAKDADGNSIANSFVVTNTHKPEVTSIKATKAWDDANNQDGLRTDVTLRLVKTVGDITSDVSTKTIEAGASGASLTVTWDNLPVYESGKAVSYSVVEPKVPSGYTSKVSGDAVNGFTVTNTHVPETVSVPVSKSWVGPKGSSAMVQLYADGVPTQRYLQITAAGPDGIMLTSDDWTGTFTSLPKYKGVRQEIKYSVEEVAQANYTATVSGTAAGFSIVNANTETTSVKVAKVWDDANNQDGVRPGSVSVQLVQDGIPVEGKTITLNADNGWQGSFVELAKYSANGAVIKYTVQETRVSETGYAAAITGDAANGYTITNTHQPEKTSITVNKAWVGPSMDYAQVQLYANGTAQGDPVTLNKANGWAYTWKSLDKYASGRAIRYTVGEVDTPDNYSATITGSAEAGYTITNTNVEKVSVSGTKTWSDDNDRDGVRPDSITVVLHASNQVEPIAAKTVTATENWTYSFDNLPKYDQATGAEISYSVTEAVVDKYTTTIRGYDITNSYAPGKTSVSVNKAWVDGNDQDGLRTGSVQVQLYADGAPQGDPVTLSAGNNWAYTWAELNQKANGQDVDYTVREVDVPTGYTADVSGNASDGFTITNSHTPATTSISVAKAWDDTNNQDGMRADSAQVQLYANGAAQGYPVTLNEANNWAYKWDGLAKKANGRDIAYTVQEVGVPAGYTATISGDANTGYTITNAHQTEKTSVKVNKAWVGPVAGSVTVHLLADGVDTGKTLTLSAENGWTGSFDGLDKYAASSVGQEVTYTVSEDAVDNYDIAVTSTASAGFAITNTNMEKVSISGHKAWLDGNNQDGLRPASITVRLLADGQEIKSRTVTADNGWAYSFDGLAKYSATDGHAIAYIVAEDPVAGYTTAAGAGYDLVNTHAPATTSISVSKSWTDANNQDGKRPGSVTVQLYANGTPVAGKTLVLSADNNWTGSFTSLPKNKGGQEIAYTVQESNVPDGYEPLVTGSMAAGFTINNAHTPETTTIAGNKTWQDSDNQDGIRPESITVHLLADGAEIDSKTVTAEDGWAYSFDNLPVYKDGSKVTYTVTEDPVEGYETTWAGFDITNAHKPEVTSVKATKVWDDANNQDGKRSDVTLHLMKSVDGAEPVLVEGQDKTISAGATGDALTATWDNLPVYEGGKKVAYSVSETGDCLTAPEGGTAAYTSTITGTAAEGFTVTNAHTPEVTSVKATKVWDDGDNQDSLRSNVTFHLTKSFDGGTPVAVEGQDKVISAAATGDDLVATWDNLPVYEGGKKVTYSVTETGDCLKAAEDGKAAPYTSTIEAAKDADGNAIANAFVVTNTHKFASWLPQAKKFYAGADANATEGQFTFTLTPMNGTDKADGTFAVTTPLGGSSLATLTNAAFDANGEAALKLANGAKGLCLQPGTYYYQLTEDRTTTGFDAAAFDIRVVVDKDYQVTTTYQLEADGTTTALGADASQVEFFNNTLTGASAAVTLGAPVSLAGGKVTVQPKVAKVLENGALTDGQFTFTLTGEGLSKTATNDINGQVAFEQIVYTQADVGKTFTYTIAEQGGGTTVNGVTYDAGTVTMKVEVKSEDGKLTAHVTYEKDGAQTTEPTFTNTAETLQVTVRKANREDVSVGLFNAVYGLWMYNANGADVYLGHQASDHDGYMTFPVPTEAGKIYYFKEESSPDGYLVDPYRSVAFTVETEKDGSHRLVYEGTDEFAKLTGGVQLTGRGIGASASQEVK